MTDALTRHIAAQLPQTGTLWVGFSGGLDSTVLLYLLTRLDAAQGRLRAIHVNHGLSVNAAVWQQHCETICQRWQVPLVCESVQVQNRGDGIEQAARAARYRVYRQSVQAGDVLLLGHHGDDQIETFFQRLLRGAGLAGLAAMPVQRSLGEGRILVRPLLGCERHKLEAVALEHQLRWVEDESNVDERYERNWWRNTLLPQIYQRFPGYKASLLRSIQQWQQDQQVLEELIAPLASRCLQDVDWPLTASKALDLTQLQSYPAHWWPYIVRHWLAELQQPLPAQQWLQTLWDEVVAAAEDAQPRLQLGQYQICRYRGCLYLVEQASADEVHAQTLSLPDRNILWAGGQLQCTRQTPGLRAGHYRLSPASAARGLTLRPAGRPAKTVKALFQEAGVPPWLREHWPALFSGECLVALLGIACDQRVEDRQAAGYRWSGNFQASSGSDGASG